MYCWMVNKKKFFFFYCRLESLMNKFTEQRKFDGRLVEQISNIEQNVTSCQVALEKLQHTIEKLSKYTRFFLNNLDFCS